MAHAYCGAPPKRKTFKIRKTFAGGRVHVGPTWNHFWRVFHWFLRDAPPFLPGGQVCMQFLRMLVHMRVFVCVLSAGRPTGVLPNPLPRPPHTPAPGTAPLYPFPFPLPLPVAFPCPSRFPPLSLICSNLALLRFTLRSRHDLAPNGRGCPPEMCGSSGRSDPN